MAFFPFRMYSRKGVKLRQYPESKLKAAYDAVTERGISQGKAAKEFEVYIAACRRGGVSRLWLGTVHKIQCLRKKEIFARPPTLPPLKGNKSSDTGIKINVSETCKKVRHGP